MSVSDRQMQILKEATVYLNNIIMQIHAGAHEFQLLYLNVFLTKIFSNIIAIIF
jgi:hypothetical protein